jgi:Inner membrane protein YgaP-like, transmembrane domain
VTVDNLVHVFAGTIILVSLALGLQASPIFHSSYWLWFTAFVGANLLQSGFTGFCPLGIMLKKLGVKESHASAG